MRLKEWRITNPALLLNKDDIIVKIRYRKQANRCTVTLQPDNTLHVQLHEPLTAIAPGQAAAFYRDDVVLGGGIIDLIPDTFKSYFGPLFCCFKIFLITFRRFSPSGRETGK